MAGSLSSENKYFLPDLTQEGHKVDVTAISESEDNYTGLLECARYLSGCNKDENSDSNAVEPCSVALSVEPNVKLGVKQASLNFQENHLSGSNLVTTSRAGHEQNFD